jgi:hypothetical protein
VLLPVVWRLGCQQGLRKPSREGPGDIGSGPLLSSQMDDANISRIGAFTGASSEHAKKGTVTSSARSRRGAVPRALHLGRRACSAERITISGRAAARAGSDAGVPGSEATRMALRLPTDEDCKLQIRNCKFAICISQFAMKQWCARDNPRWSAAPVALESRLQAATRRLKPGLQRCPGRQRCLRPQRLKEGI